MYNYLLGDRFISDPFLKVSLGERKLILFRRRTQETPLDIVKKYAEEKLVVNSPAFGNGGRIPDKYTCVGPDVSPPLTISNVPDEAVELALVMYDPDAPIGVFYHWTLYSIPRETRSLPENIPKEEVTEYGVQGRNDFGRIGYGGPCPPRGHGTHRYYFLVLALNSEIGLAPGVSAKEFLRTIEGKVIGYGVLMGTYSR